MSDLLVGLGRKLLFSCWVTSICCRWHTSLGSLLRAIVCPWNNWGCLLQLNYLFRCLSQKLIAQSFSSAAGFSSCKKQVRLRKTSGPQKALVQPNLQKFEAFLTPLVCLALPVEIMTPGWGSRVGLYFLCCHSSRSSCGRWYIPSEPRCKGTAVGTAWTQMSPSPITNFTSCFISCPWIC